MTIARLIEGRSGEIISCETTALVSEAIAILAQRRIGALPVTSSGAVVGIFSERDVIYQLEAQGSGVLNKQVGEVMTSPPITVTLETGVLSALALMTRRRLRHLPVLEQGEMIAFISIGDLVKHRIDRIESEAEAMRAYIQAA